MMNLFIGIVLGVMAGIGASALLVALRETWVEDSEEFDLSDLIDKVEPVEMSVMEQHRQKHLAAYLRDTQNAARPPVPGDTHEHITGGSYGTASVRRSDPERSDPGITGSDPDRQV